jgi:hypothetical protein
MHQQLWGYKVEWKSVSRGTGGKKVEYHCFRARNRLHLKKYGETFHRTATMAQERKEILLCGLNNILVSFDLSILC